MYIFTETADLVVIGSGPGGYVAAIKAAQLGLKVCWLDRLFLNFMPISDAKMLSVQITYDTKNIHLIMSNAAPTKNIMVHEVQNLYFILVSIISTNRFYRFCILVTNVCRQYVWKRTTHWAEHAWMWAVSPPKLSSITPIYITWLSTMTWQTGESSVSMLS